MSDKQWLENSQILPNFLNFLFSSFETRRNSSNCSWTGGDQGLTKSAIFKVKASTETSCFATNNSGPFTGHSCLRILTLTMMKRRRKLNLHYQPQTILLSCSKEVTNIIKLSFLGLFTWTDDSINKTNWKYLY